MNTGLSATLIFSGQGALGAFSARFRSIGEIPESVEDLDDTGLDSTDYMEVVPDDLKSLEPFDCEIFWDGKKTVPVGVLGTITLTFPIQAGQTAARIMTGSGYIRRSATPPLAVGQRLFTTVQVRFDGKTGPTITLAS